MFNSVVVCHEPGEIGGPYFEGVMGTVRPPSPIVLGDPISGSAFPDDSLRQHDAGNHQAVKHGSRLVNSSNAQYPIPMEIAGGTPFGPTGKQPAALSVGGDLVSAPNRYSRYPAIARIKPETTATIGSVSRQSYQYIKNDVMDPRPFNAFGNPASPSGEPNRVAQIGPTILPALEPPRYNYVGLDTGYIQEQADLLQIKAMMAGG